ncbi:MAG: heme-binding domain-containing protein [Chitinophagaceae bacterium]|nr:heme-binding domain-containing protein [Chitinophagaceae bacterium]MBK8951188.1 heme-binding domain-containing protein [Chitinophagaceae bacterium]
MFKKTLLALLVVLVAIQFIHPKRNISEGPKPNYIGNNYAVPDDVKSILTKACNDCHSNNTRYPWYSKLQPIHWWLNKHVVDGKKHINYDEFINRPLRYQYHKLEETIEMVKEGEMPLKSYTWTHKDAKLTKEEKLKITDWVLSVMDNMKSKYPIDSLVKSNR